jgi:hypothetical protein
MTLADKAGFAHLPIDSRAGCFPLRFASHERAGRGWLTGARRIARPVLAHAAREITCPQK